MSGNTPWSQPMLRTLDEERSASASSRSSQAGGCIPVLSHTTSAAGTAEGMQWMEAMGLDSLHFEDDEMGDDVLLSLASLPDAGRTVLLCRAASEMLTSERPAGEPLELLQPGSDGGVLQRSLRRTLNGQSLADGVGGDEETRAPQCTVSEPLPDLFTSFFGESSPQPRSGSRSGSDSGSGSGPGPSPSSGVHKKLFEVQSRAISDC